MRKAELPLSKNKLPKPRRGLVLSKPGVAFSPELPACSEAANPMGNLNVQPRLLQLLRLPRLSFNHRNLRLMRIRLRRPGAVADFCKGLYQPPLGSPEELYYFKGLKA